MPDFTLTNVPPVLLQEWTAYAKQSGLPLEYLILEAVTYSVRSDRLGVEAARLICVQRQKTLAATQKHIQKNGSMPQDRFHDSISAQPTPESMTCTHSQNESEDSPHSGQVVHNLPTEYMDSSESSAALEDFVPRNL
jgi:hypothetical protein